MRCPYCQHHDSKVLDTSHDSHGGIRRRRECFNCGQRFSTYERPILATPLIVKQDGTREEFDREKMARGIRIGKTVHRQRECGDGKSHVQGHDLRPRACGAGFRLEAARVSAGLPIAASDIGT